MTSRPLRINGLSDLKLVKREIATQALQRTQLATELAHAKQQAGLVKNLFIQAAGAVKPLPDKRKLLLKIERTVPQVM